MRYLIICAGILFIWGAISQYRVNSLQDEVQKLELNNKNLELQIGRARNAELEANKTIAALREAAEINQNNFDWYRQPVPADVLGELQKRHNRHRSR